jgi:hypothetical protein
VVVVVVVVVLLGPLLPPPPHPTASTSMAAPPKSATEFLAAVLIEVPNPHLHHKWSTSPYPGKRPCKRDSTRGLPWKRWWPITGMGHWEKRSDQQSRPETQPARADGRTPAPVARVRAAVMPDDECVAGAAASPAGLTPIPLPIRITTCLLVI